jgi:hypothetical protein
MKRTLPIALSAAVVTALSAGSVLAEDTCAAVKEWPTWIDQIEWIMPDNCRMIPEMQQSSATKLELVKTRDTRSVERPLSRRFLRQMSRHLTGDYTEQQDPKSEEQSSSSSVEMEIEAESSSSEASEMSSSASSEAAAQ